MELLVLERLKMNTVIKPIRSEVELNAALGELRGLFSFAPGTPEYDRAEVLEILIEDYEDKVYPIEDPDPIEVIKYVMAENGLNQSELGKIIGDRAKASLIINRKRALSLSMIRRLNTELKIPVNLLIKEYTLIPA